MSGLPQIRPNKVRLDNETLLLPKFGIPEDENITYRDCYILKVKHLLPLIDREPFMLWVSGNMFLYPPYKRFEQPRQQKTNGLWGDSENPAIRHSLYQLAMISRPTDKELEIQFQQYGYHMEWPPPLVQRWLPTTMKYFTKQKERGEYSDVKFFQAIGIVSNETGAYLRQYGQATAGYFIMKNAPGCNEVRKSFLDSQPLWYRKQYIVAWGNYITHQARIVARSKKAIERASRELPDHELYGQCLPEVDETLVEDLPTKMRDAIIQFRM